MSKAIWILYDQCDIESKILKSLQPEDHIIMVESRKELDLPYTHKKKTAFILSVMRHFARSIQSFHPHVHLITLDESQDFTQLEMMAHMTLSLGLKHVHITTPKSIQHRETLKTFTQFRFTLYKDQNIISDELTMLPWFKSKSFRMETFYQKMRQATGFLMDEFNQPLGGVYNFDKENQKPLKNIPKKHPRVSFKKDELTLSTLEEVKLKFPHQLGDVKAFHFSIDSRQANIECDHFIQNILPYFGPYQDNMIKDDAYVAHSLLSSYLNIGLLSPKSVCQKVHHATLQGHVDIASAEGFMRQILGWREYMFYKYLTLMPQLLQNALVKDANPLPALYWGGPTQMNCLHHTIKDSLEHAYSHHIQRLMISANFANLARINPYEVHTWFLGIYADGYEWVEIPNTLGMGLSQNQGRIASKPYISSGAYIKKMSNYCDGCYYNPKELTGERACPFNSLYWQYIADHKDRLKSNPRTSMMVASYESFSDEKKESITHQTHSIIERLKEGNL